MTDRLEYVALATGKRASIQLGEAPGNWRRVISEGLDQGTIAYDNLDIITIFEEPEDVGMPAGSKGSVIFFSHGRATAGADPLVSLVQGGVICLDDRCSEAAWHLAHGLQIAADRQDMCLNEEPPAAPWVAGYLMQAYDELSDDERVALAEITQAIPYVALMRQARSKLN